MDKYIRLETYNNTSKLYRWYAYDPSYDDSEIIQYPKQIVIDWFRESGRDKPEDYALPTTEDRCEYWVNHLYTLGEIDDLYEYAKEHGCVWTRYFAIGGKEYTLDDLAKIYRGEIDMGDPYGIHDDNTVFWDWISSLYALRVIEYDSVKVEIKKSKYTVYYTMTGSVEVEATSEAEAKLLASGMEIKFDDDGYEVASVIKEG